MALRMICCPWGVSVPLPRFQFPYQMSTTLLSPVITGPPWYWIGYALLPVEPAGMA